MSISKDRKFLFDNNNFDLPDALPEPEVYIEPPPIFTLEDLAFARDDAFAKGREAGLEEARISREQYLAEQTERVLQELKFLIGAEEYRAAVYEREVLSLTETIFKTLLPSFTEREGIEEVKTVISKVLANQPEQPSIVIELPQEDAEAIETYFIDTGIDPSKVIFKSSPTLTRASCRMSWKDGGALRDHQIIADEILRTLQPHIPTHGVKAEEPAPLAKEVEKDETESDSPPASPQVQEGD